MPLFPMLLLSSTFLCSLVAGFLFAFAVVAMPGLARLDDAGFLQAFREIDGVIQRNSPLFLLVWGGSVLTLIAAAAMGFGSLAGTDRLLLLGATLLYLFGVQLPTVAVNVPLNNRLQALDLATMDAPALREARQAFETRWNRSNILRTVLACVSSLLLLGLLLRL